MVPGALELSTSFLATCRRDRPWRRRRHSEAGGDAAERRRGGRGTAAVKRYGGAHVSRAANVCERSALRGRHVHANALQRLNHVLEGLVLALCYHLLPGAQNKGAAPRAPRA